MTFKYSPGDRVRIVDGSGTTEPEYWEGLEFEVAQHDGHYVTLRDNGKRPDRVHGLHAWPPEKICLVDEAHDLREQLNRANGDLVALRHAHANFRDKVRRTTLEAKTVHSLCADGVNSFLSNLGLDPIEKEYTVTVTAEVHVMASSPANAATEAQDLLPRDYEWVVTPAPAREQPF